MPVEAVSDVSGTQAPGVLFHLDTCGVGLSPTVQGGHPHFCLLLSRDRTHRTPSFLSGEVAAFVHISHVLPKTKGAQMQSLSQPLCTRKNFYDFPERKGILGDQQQLSHQQLTVKMRGSIWGWGSEDYDPHPVSRTYIGCLKTPATLAP